MKKILEWFTVNRYFKMNDAELENEARKYNIKQYGNPQSGLPIRQIIIEQLIAKDKANNSRLAIIISIVALVVSMINIVLTNLS